MICRICKSEIGNSTFCPYCGSNPTISGKRTGAVAGPYPPVVYPEAPEEGNAEQRGERERREGSANLTIMLRLLLLFSCGTFALQVIILILLLS